MQYFGKTNNNMAQNPKYYIIYILHIHDAFHPCRFGKHHKILEALMNSGLNAQGGGIHNAQILTDLCEVARRTS
jgi:hypothetical protein